MAGFIIRTVNGFIAFLTRCILILLLMVAFLYVTHLFEVLLLQAPPWVLATGIFGFMAALITAAFAAGGDDDH